MMNRIRKKDLVFIFFFSLALIIVWLAIISNQNNSKLDIYALITFAINTIIVYIHLIESAKKNSFSFDTMFWLFSFFFFCTAPLIQFLTKKFAWNLVPSDLEILITNLYLTIWFIFYSVGWRSGLFRLTFNKKKRLKTETNKKAHKYTINHSVLNVLLGVAVVIVLYYFKRVGIKNLLLRSTNIDSSIDSKAVSLLTNQGFHNALAFIAALHIIDAKQNGAKIQTVLAVLCFFIGCFPTGIARNMAASFYIGMLIIMFDSSRKKRWITWIIYAGLIVVFPAINLFRNLNTFHSMPAMRYVVSNLQGTYLSGDYDAYQMIISVRRWIQRDGLTWGRQLLGVLLFFIPRSIWGSKPVGTGQAAFEALNQHWYTNVSAPLPAEGYANFGLFGIIMFGLLTGFFASKVDRLYWKEQNDLSIIRIIYPFQMMMFFFVCRGDLQSAGSYFLAQLLTGYTICKIAIRKKTIITF